MRAILALLQQRANAPAVGKDQLGIELRERLEDEASFREPRMRHLEAGLVDDLVAVEEKVEVDRARAEARARSHPAERPFDLEEPVEQLARTKVRPDLRGRVQEPRLVSVVHRIGLAYARKTRRPDLAFHELERSAEIRLTVAQVRAEPDVGERRRQPSRAVNLYVRPSSVGLPRHAYALPCGSQHV